MNRLILIALALGLSLTGCGGSHDTPNGPQATSSSVPGSSSVASSSSTAVAVVPTAGRIALGVLPVGLKRTGTQLATDSLPTVDTATSIELGTLKGSKAFFFIIRNVGGAPIESLTVTTDNAAVAMTPGYIPVLNTDATSSLQQIAELDVTHGTDILNRSFKKALLPYGRQTFTLSFKGVSLGQPFHAEFKIGMAAVFVRLLNAGCHTFLMDSVPTPACDYTKLDSTLSYGGTSCIVNFWSTHPAAGDSVSGAATNWERSPQYSSDCVTEPAVPVM